MTFSLLFDLDDTLLETNLDAFLPGYFKKLAGHFAKSIAPQQFIDALLRSTQIMYDSKSVDMTLEQVFSQHFYPALGLPREQMAGELEYFYDEVFPALQPLTRPMPGAVEMVEWAFSQGWNVAIATDPLFPRKAILHRLRWAGLAPEKYPFTLISDFQSFHFAKASVAYYPEFLARMGWADSPVMMVGDSMERDVIPSQQAGLPVFWLKKDDQAAQPGIAQGGFADLRNYLETTDLSGLKVDYHAPSALGAFLQATPAVLHTVSLAMTESQWTGRTQPGEWSFLEVLCHLRDVDAEVNLVRLDAILNGENPVIAAQTTDQWAEERQYNQQNPADELAHFVTARQQLVERLASLKETDWQRPARHTIFGPTTIHELVGFMVDHDQLHIRQALMAAAAFQGMLSLFE